MISLVISIICLVCFTIISLFLCFILLKRKRDNLKVSHDIEETDLKEETTKPPVRRKRRRSELHYVGEEDYPSPNSIPVPFNTPDQYRQKRKHFQPMNGKQKRKKKSKHAQRKQCQNSKGPADVECISSIPRPAVEYYNSKVVVSPLNFSDKNYTVNRITETIFAGSIHRGYNKVSVVCL